MKSFMRMAVVLALFALPALVSAEQPSVPQVLGFHSVIRDEGGNPIADGERNVAFRIKDAQDLAVYEETQGVAVVEGQISALIGNGLDANGAPTGGVPLEAIDPVVGRYLEVEVEGYSPISGMELASVPYSSYAQVALGAADKSVGFEALADGAVDEIAKAITGGAGKEAIVLREELDTIYSGQDSASYIGVAPAGLSYSTSTDLQNVLGDLDGAIATNSQGIANEAGLRASGDSQRISRSGDTMNGTLTMNAGIVMADGQTVDGYDVGNEFAALNSRTANLGRIIWGSVTGGVTPSIIGPNVSVSYVSAGTYRINFNSPMPSEQYALIASTRAGTSETPGVPRIYEKSASGFTAQIPGAVSNNFDFAAIGM